MTREMCGNSKTSRKTVETVSVRDGASQDKRGFEGGGEWADLSSLGVNLLMNWMWGERARKGKKSE